MTLTLLGSAQACNVFFRDTGDERTALLARKNSLGLEDRSKMTVQCNGKLYFCRVKLLSGDIDDAHRDNIHLSDKLGQGTDTGTYWKASETRYKANLALKSPKSRWSLGGTLLTLGGAVMTALHASSASLAANPAHFDTTAWTLFACTGLGACFSWYKDNLA